MENTTFRLVQLFLQADLNPGILRKQEGPENQAWNDSNWVNEPG